MKNSIIKAYRFALFVDKKILENFVKPVWEATLKSVLATFGLPQTIVNAVREYKESVRFDAELEAALIDHCFLDRASTGLSAEESSKIKRIMKDFS